MNGVMEFHNEALGVQIRTILNEDGSISMNAEDTAIGFGWIDKSKFATSGEMYVRWARINKYLSEFGFSQQVAKDDYIPESLFYLLGMKASNKAAQEFQKWLAIEVIPTIRKTGGYTMRPKQDYSYPLVNEVQVKFYNDMPVLTLDDLCTLFACSKSVLSSKMYNCCWPNIHRYVLDGYELAEFKQRYPQYRSVPRLTLINQEGVDRLNFTGRPVDLLQLKPCEEQLELAPQTVSITINISGQTQLPPDKREILQKVSEQLTAILQEDFV